MKPVIVTGTKRAGTSYMAALITASGYWCSHEHHFRGSKRFAISRSTIECAWTAAPFLKGLGAYVVHQVRHPLLVLSSMMTRGDFTNMKSAWSPGVCPQSVKWGDDRISLCLRFWLEWNKMIEPYAQFRWRIDDVMYADVSGALTDCGRPVDESRVRIAAAVIPERINQGQSVKQFAWQDVPEGQLKESVMRKAQEYGYTV